MAMTLLNLLMVFWATPGQTALVSGLLLLLFSLFSSDIEPALLFCNGPFLLTVTVPELVLLKRPFLFSYQPLHLGPDPLKT